MSIIFQVALALLDVLSGLRFCLIFDNVVIGVIGAAVYYGLHLLVVHWSSFFSFSFLCDLSLVVCNMSERIHICMSYSPILWTTLENAECEIYMYIFIIWNCSWDSSIDGNSTSSADITASFSKFVSQLKSMKCSLIEHNAAEPWNKCHLNNKGEKLW